MKNASEVLRLECDMFVGSTGGGEEGKLLIDDERTGEA